MRPTGSLLVLGLAVCAGAWLVWSGWRQPVPRLARMTARLERRPGGDAATGGAVHAFGDVVLQPPLRRLTERWREPLRLIGRSAEVHAGLLATAAVMGFVTPAALAAVAVASGLGSTATLVPLAVAIALAALAPALVHAAAMGRAEEVRVDLRHQLAAFLDMVTMLLAGTSGHEGALDHAARAGDGLLFRELRRRMREVAATGSSHVEALSVVAEDYGLVELEQVAAATALSSAEGAPVARTLAAKCATLRSTLASDEESAARIRNDKVTPPLVGMALLFMALIIYPALDLH